VTQDACVRSPEGQIGTVEFLGTRLRHERDAVRRCRDVLERMLDFLDARAAGLVLRDEPSGEWLTVAEAGDVPDPRGNGPDGATGHIARLAVREARATLLRDDGDEVTLLGLPLAGADRIDGAVWLALDPGSAISEDLVRPLLPLVDHVAALVESRRVLGQHSPPAHRVGEPSKLDELKSHFLSMVSHELRTPLTAIIGYTDLLLRQVHGSLNERQHKHQIAVKKAAHRLLTLINDLLDVTRLESGLVALHRSSVPLASVFDGAIEQIEPIANEREIELRLDVPTALPTVLADGERLIQILVNLLDNAVKFTPPGGQVTLRAERTTSMVRVSVRDTGLGVRPEDLPEIWHRLHQGDSSSRRRFGVSGLGLAIVRNLVELHGGSAEVYSDGEGLGSTFSFTVPLATALQEQPLPSGRSSDEDGGAQSLGTRKVLIVDDDQDNREVIASIVGDVMGHAALLAESGRQALALARERPDLILLDLRMPDIDGFEVARRLKSDSLTAQIPIVAITALADEDDQQAAISAGCVGCVTKPFTPASLSGAIDDAMRAESPTTGNVRG
jgi:signal transduction histidine kinase/ActR/RegA family two-component response regulator